MSVEPRRNTMADTALPDIASMLQQVMTSVQEASRPRLLALLERTAAGRYEGWARELPAHATALLACAARENEIAATAEGIFPLDAARREKLATPLQTTREAYFAALAPLSLRDQFRLQAIAERAGGGAWRAMAAALGDARARAALERSGDLEEANATALDELVAKLR
jgi:hypothetical protein